MTPSTLGLLEMHQAIIDAWYRNWHREQQKRVDEWAARKAPTATPSQARP